MQVLFFLNAAVLSRKILVKTKYWIGTRYRQILNVKGLRSVLGGGGSAHTHTHTHTHTHAHTQII